MFGVGEVRRRVGKFFASSVEKKALIYWTFQCNIGGASSGGYFRSRPSEKRRRYLFVEIEGDSLPFVCWEGPKGFAKVVLKWSYALLVEKTI